MKKATQTQIDKARQFSLELMQLSIQSSFDGTLSYDVENFNPNWKDLLLEYLNGERTSVKLIWMVMAREVGIWSPPTEEQILKGQALMIELFTRQMGGEELKEDALSQLWDVMKVEK